MRDIMLIVHFIGLAMGLGTSIAFMIFGIASSKMEKEEGQKFIVNAFTLSKMGNIGIVILIISGGYLITPYWPILTSMPLLMAKLVLVLVLAAFIGIISSYVKKAKKGDAETYLKKIALLGRLSLLTALTIVVLAVYIFH